MCTPAKERGNRVVGVAVVWAIVSGWAVICPGCLQQEDMSADFLTSFEEGSPAPVEQAGPAAHQVVEHHAMPPGAAANAAIDGDEIGRGAASSDSETRGEKPKPGGGGETPAPASVGDAATGDAVAETSVGGGASAEPGSDAPVVGVPEFHPHREMPPGYGSSLPPDPQPQEVPAPVSASVPPAAGAPGEPEKVMPAVLSPFEREFEGQKFVAVSGTISYEGDKVTTVDIDCFVKDTSTRAGRKLVNKIKVEGPGAYTMKVPANYGELYVASFMDLGNDGPDSSDPQGSYEHNPLKIGDEDIEHVDIVLRRSAGGAQ